MSKVTFISSILLTLTCFVSNAQQSQASLIEDISYVYIEKLIATAKENYPRVKAMNTRIDIAETAVTNAKLAWLAPLSLSYVYSPSNALNLNNPTFFRGYQLAFSLNFVSLLQTPASVRRAKEELKIEHLNQEEYNLSLVTEVKTRYFTYLAAQKNLKLAIQSSLDAQNVLTMLKYKFEKGEVSFSDYNTALTGFTENNRSKIESEVAMLSAKTALEELLGIRLEEVPN